MSNVHQIVLPVLHNGVVREIISSPAGPTRYRRQFRDWSDPVTMVLSMLYDQVASMFSGLICFATPLAKHDVNLPQAEVLSRVKNVTQPADAMYKDLTSGEMIDIWYDAVAMRCRNKKTGAPVEFYIDTSTNDTVFGT